MFHHKLNIIQVSQITVINHIFSKMFNILLSSFTSTSTLPSFHINNVDQNQYDDVEMHSFDDNQIIQVETTGFFGIDGVEEVQMPLSVRFRRLAQHDSYVCENICEQTSSLQCFCGKSYCSKFGLVPKIKFQFTSKFDTDSTARDEWDYIAQIVNSPHLDCTIDQLVKIIDGGWVCSDL